MDAEYADIYDAIKGYESNNECIECYLVLSVLSWYGVDC